MIYTERVLVRDNLRAGMPTILLLIGSVPFAPLLEFFRENALSLSRERAYAQATGRFVEWLSVRAEEFYSIKHRDTLYSAYVSDLRFGTYRDGEEVYGLYWQPISNINLRRLTKCLTDFSDWLRTRYGTTMLNPIAFNASTTDQMIFWRGWNKRKANSILAHLKSRNNGLSKDAPIRKSFAPSGRNRTLEEAKAFPADKIDELLRQGFINPGRKHSSRIWEKYNLRDILITLLCLYGGCRPSEPLHLWVEDVFVDPTDENLALVLIHEPCEGRVDYIDPLTGTRKKILRADFLQRYCGGRKPLVYETGRRHAGWKGALLTHRDRQAFQVIWIDKAAGRLFLKLWRLYIQHVRPVTLGNPWAFLTKDSQPLGTEGFSDSFRAAVRRIGLVPTKWAGTSPHGPRHRYGQWLNELGISEKAGQVAMHHLNAKSQDVYRQMGIAQVVDAVGRHANLIDLPKDL